MHQPWLRTRGTESAKSSGFTPGFFSIPTILKTLYRGFPTYHHASGGYKGKPISFDDWAKGSVVSANNSVIDNRNFLFNYDKVTNNLFIALDTKTAIEVSKEEFKSFTLGKDDNEHAFTHVFLIDNDHFFQTIVKMTRNIPCIN